LTQAEIRRRVRNIGAFEGHFEGKRLVIDKITVDTTPFYE
jgi:hypothetical protein